MAPSVRDQIERGERRVSQFELLESINELKLTITKGFAESNSLHNGARKELDVLAKHHETLLHAVYGNGSEGLITRVAKLQQKLQALLWVLGVLFTAYVAQTFIILRELLLA